MTPDPPIPPVWYSALAWGVLGLMVYGWTTGLRRLAAGRSILRRQGRKRVPWGGEGACLAGFLLGTTAVMYVTSDGDQLAEIQVDFEMALAYAANWILMSVVAAGFLVLRYDVSPGDLGLPSTASRGLGQIGVGTVAAAVALAPVYAIQAALVWGLGLPSSHPTTEQLVSEPTLNTVVAAFTMAVVIAPVFEELAFRVLLQGWLEKLAGRRAWWPIMVTSTAFALAHAGQGWAPVPLWVLSLAIGYVYRQTHAWLAVVAMHMTFNALSLAAAIAQSQAAATP